MRQALTGWIVFAGCLVLLGIGTLVGARASSTDQVPTATVEQWRRYATEVERGTRTPNATATRILTETAIAQNEYAASAARLLNLVGGSIALLGLLLTLDLVRYRARHTTPPQRKED